MADIALGIVPGVLGLCHILYQKLELVKRYKQDCERLVTFLEWTEQFLQEARKDANMTTPDWKRCLEALESALQEVECILDACKRFGKVRSLLEADDIHMRMNTAKQNLQTALQMVPINQGRMAHTQLVDLKSQLQAATFEMTRAAEEQAAQLMRLMDLEKANSSQNNRHHEHTHDTLAKILALLDSETRQGPGHNHAELLLELEDLRQATHEAQRGKKQQEEQYLQLAIQHIQALELQSKAQTDTSVPFELRCPLTLQLYKDPVMVFGSGHTYERADIEEWFARGNMTDPLTGMQLASTAIQSNHQLRSAALSWRQQHEAGSSSGTGSPAAARASASTSTENQRAPAAAEPAGASELTGAPQRLWSSGPSGSVAGRDSKQASAAGAAPPAPPAPASVGAGASSSSASPGRPVPASQAVPTQGHPNSGGTQFGADSSAQDASLAVLAFAGASKDSKIKAAIDLLTSQDPSLRAQRQAAQALSAIAASSTTPVAAIAGGVQPLVRLLSSTDQETQAYSCCALACMAEPDANQAPVIVSSGAVPVIVKLLGSPSVSVQERAADALYWLAKGSQGCAKAVVAAGAVPALVHVLSSEAVGVQEQACWALGVLACEDSACKGAIVSAGGVDLLVKLLGSSAVSVQRQASWALYWIAYDGQQHAMAAVAAGAVPALVHLLSSKAVGVQEQACWALGVLAYEDGACKDAIVSAGGGRLLVKLLGGSAVSVQRQAAWALYWMVWGSQARAKAVAAGAVPALVHLLSSEAVDVQEEACRVLGMLALVDTACKDAIVSAGGVNPLVKLLSS